MDIKVLTIQLTNSKIDPRDIPKVRGYIVNKFPQHIELRNHADRANMYMAIP